MAEPHARSRKSRIIRIVIFCSALLACIGAIPAATLGIWFAMAPIDSRGKWIALTAVVVGCLGIFGFAMGLCWMALENVVEEYWQAKWLRWQELKQRLISRS